MSWIDDINKQLEKNRESLRKKGYDSKKLAEQHRGSVQGDINAKSGHMKRIQKLGGSKGGKVSGPIQGSKKYVCPHCEDVGNSNAWKAKHFDNCIGKVYQYDKDTKDLVGVYTSTKQVLKINNNEKWNRQLINNAIIGKKKSAYGFIWERKR